MKFLEFVGSALAFALLIAAVAMAAVLLLPFAAVGELFRGSVRR